MSPPLPPSAVIQGIDPKPGNENVFSVGRLHPRSPYYAGRSPSGECALLIRTQGGSRTVPLLLAGIQVLFAVQCRIREGDAAWTTDEFTVVCCSSRDVRVESYFASVLDLMVQRLGEVPDAGAVEDAVLHLVALFKKLQLAPTQTIIGVVGELLFIAASAAPQSALDAWHADTGDRFDFSSAELRVDCKASSLRTRVHEFSIEQTNPPPVARALVMSVFVEAAGDGQSLSDLLLQLEGKLGDLPRIMKLRDQVARGLGSSYLEHLEWRFDRQLADSSISLYDVTDIPRLLEPLPQGVSRVRFSSDLGMAKKVARTTLTSLPPTLVALLPAAASAYA